MSKIELLTTPASSNRNPEECLGLEYLASESRANGHEVIYVDAWMNGMSVEETVSNILLENPEVVGLSPSMDSIENCKKLIIKLRENHFQGKIVLGGIYASFEAGSIVEEIGELIDGVLIGEADETFQIFLQQNTIKGIPGAVYQKNGEVYFEDRVCAPDSLDNLPYPSRDSLDKVRSLKTPSHVMGSRGCYGNCSFCSVVCFQKFSSEKRWRGRSPKSIVGELRELVAKGETMVKFIDDNWFGGRDKSRELEIAKLIQKEGIKIRFRLSLRVNDVTDELITELKKAGLFAVSLGVESFVQRKLRDYNKGTTVEQNLASVKILQKHGIFVQMGHIMFDPFITMEEVEEEIKYLKETDWAITKGICTQIFAAEGTKITERIKREVGVTGKQGTNYLYKIVDEKVNSLYETIRPWAKHVSSLYDVVIDPISAPKNIPQEGHVKFHLLCQELRRFDIELAEAVISCMKEGNAEPQRAVQIFKEFHTDDLARINRQAEQLYLEYGLQSLASNNKYIY